MFISNASEERVDASVNATKYKRVETFCNIIFDRTRTFLIHFELQHSRLLEAIKYFNCLIFVGLYCTIEDHVIHSKKIQVPAAPWSNQNVDHVLIFMLFAWNSGHSVIDILDYWRPENQERIAWTYTAEFL